MIKTIISASVLAIIISMSYGCRSPKLAAPSQSDSQVSWGKLILRNYPGWKAPKKSPLHSRLKNYQEPQANNVMQIENRPADNEDFTFEPVDDHKLTHNASTIKEPMTNKAISYTVKAGDSLQSISKKFYKTTRRYLLIFNANKKLLQNNPNKIKPGMVLQIPSV